ncbi:MAG: RDD family protein [Gloeobacteraceae cyanobacterium ES-bin-144]|nr:RDD family protein [Verrucomicrobiales bacterium]
MDIWIIQNGEKIGPIHDFDVRKKIEAGELQANTPAWHEGQPAWMPLVEINLFEREFNQPFSDHGTPDSPPLENQASYTIPPLPENPHLVRRFWARWLDLYLFAGIYWFGMWAIGRDIQATLNNPWVILFFYIPWFIIEAYLIHRFGTTPGKWLLGIKITNNNGSQLSLSEGTRRSARVLLLGIAFGWEIVTLICQLIAFFTTKSLGRPLWDKLGGHRLLATPLQPIKIAAYVFTLFVALQLQAIVLVPYLMDEAAKQSPQLKQLFEKYPPWHLPKRN